MRRVHGSDRRKGQCVRASLRSGKWQGATVTTLEGLGTPEKPDAVQAAFIAEQAAQCGYCTNGMIMTAKALLTRHPNPTLEQVKQGLAGNLCRCGTHTRILSAVMRAARRRKEACHGTTHLSMSRRDLLKRGSVLIVGFAFRALAQTGAPPGL